MKRNRKAGKRQEPRGVQPGDIPSASRWNAMEDAIRSRRVEVAHPLRAHEGAGGTTIDADIDEPIWVRIAEVGAAGVYGWHRIVGDVDSAGSWLDGKESGTTALDPLYEANGSDTLQVGDRVQAEREVASGRLQCQAEKCP